MRHALVFGGSGQIGEPLIDRLHDDGWRITAVSRRACSDQPGVHWLQGDLAGVDGLPRAVDAIFSCGPLDAFGAWYARSPVEAARVVAFGSTSVEVKRGSADPEERAVARRLREGEQRVFETAAARGAHATLLRPTLVYGSGHDRTLSRIAATALRWGRLLLPRNAHGLRQPVHVDDLAATAFAAVTAEAAHGKTYALPGGETLTYRDMVARVLACLQPPPRLVEVPSPVFQLALGLAQLAGHGTGLGQAAVARMRSDLVFDPAPAQRDLGHAPRTFQPRASMFRPD
jgi:nucleoside-diphosphate-sugar epimerase